MKRTKTVLTANGHDSYAGSDGSTMERENGAIIRDGYEIEMHGRWVLRGKSGNYVDHDRYRNDLAERNHIDL